MHLHKTTNWLDPLSVARGVPLAEDNWLLLHSAMDSGYTGRYSFLGVRAREIISGSNFDSLAEVLTNNKEKFVNSWFGYLGYGLKNSLEKLPEDASGLINMPDLSMLRFGLIMVFDHHAKNVEIWTESEDDLQYIPEICSYSEPDVSIKNIASNMTKDEYFAKVELIKEAIKRGDLYQANLTRKFFGEFTKAPNAIDLFCKLCQISPAPYASFLKIGGKYIISSSPERFLHIDANCSVDTRPIKGSAPRFADPLKDAEAKLALQNSAKDRAENLMIVDLSRNDLSRNCEAGSVKTENLFEVTSYATVHHMASTITGKKRPDISTIELIKGCFPPGSMTGAPKIKAMQFCSELEQLKRGIYSGSIGWFGGDGSSDLAVVIRTIIIDDDNFEFQVGGAIVTESTAENEWHETLTKARAMALALGIDLKELEF
jgi:para-aminobenzoate synthetase component 1